ncbi:MAG: hypothetical protein F4018_01200 [Acidobacteria bacterium]|nr:hypothetical protein [Acidimicrobiaceae bacterium]MYK87065.1 hypothetical protein [Acidobacteriota bacterium]
MADYPPFMNAYGNVTKILNKIKEAKTPDRFSHDYLDTVLGFSGGGARPFIALAKRIGLLNTDGTPTSLYNQFRNPAQSEQAMATMVRRGYRELYKRNEFTHALDESGLSGLVVEVTGLEEGSNTLRAIVKTFLNLTAFANFELEPVTQVDDDGAGDEKGSDRQASDDGTIGRQDQVGQLRFSHNIYLNLPDTNDVEVFNAIFKALKDNLLR